MMQHTLTPRQWRPTHCVAVFNFTAKNPRELSLRIGDVVKLIDSSDLDWWKGILPDNRKGIFPSNICTPLGLYESIPFNSQSAVELEELDAIIVDVQTGDHFQVVSAQKEEELQEGVETITTTVTKKQLSLPYPLLKVRKWLNGNQFLFVRIIIYLLLCGIITPLVSAAMDQLMSQFFILHKMPLDALRYWPLQLLYWILFSFFLISIAFIITKYFSPHSAGSGVPEVKVILSGIDLPEYTSFRTLIGKVIGLSLVIGAGMFAGKQGPMVHIGTMVAVAIAKLPGFNFLLETSDLRSQILTAGAATGISSHFGTPIAGLLFTIEITSSYYAIRNYWFAALSSAIASLLMRAISNINTTGSFFDPVFSGYLRKTSFGQMDFATLGVGILTGILTGFLAVAFTNFTTFFFKIRKTFDQFFIYRYPIFYVLLVALFTCVVTFPYTFGNYMSLAVFPTIKSLFTNIPDTSNPFPSSSSSSSSTSTQVLEGQWGRWHPLIGFSIMLICRFVLTAASIPLPIPIGLYATNMIIGAIFGRIIGELFHMATPLIEPNVISMISAASYVGAITHTHSSAIVLIEMTGDMTFGLHTILATIIAILIARKLSDSIFEKIIKLRSLPFLPDYKYSNKPMIVEDIMRKLVRPLEQRITLERLKDFLVDDMSFVFPIVSNQNELFLGYVNRTELHKIISKSEKKAKKSMLKESNFEIQLPYEPGTVTVVEDTPLSQLHLFFIQLRLRFAFVTRLGKVVGLVTREMLTNIIKEQQHII